MSTLGSVMNSALKSLSMNQLALSVASNNIANAQTPEYTRQRLVTAPSGPGDDIFNIGTGVDVLRVQAVRDDLIEKRLLQETSARSYQDVLSRTLSDVEVSFNDSQDSGVLLAITNFFNGFHTLSLDPASMNFREGLKINATALMNTFRSRADILSNLRQLADNTIGAEVNEVNSLTREIAAISLEIKSREGLNVSHDLRDRRASLVRELGQFVEVHELASGDEYQISTKNNRLLVLNGTSLDLSKDDVSTEIGEGSLKANLEMRDTYVPSYANALDQLAYEIVQEVNSLHSGAYSLDGNTGINFFAPLATASGAAKLMALSSDVTNDARAIAASDLSVGTDNGAATRLGNLLHDAVFSGGTLTDQYSSLIFRVGADTSNAKARLSQHEAIKLQLENRRSSISGVSIDEETVQILQFQRAYQASAKLIQTVDQLLQTALGLTQ